MRQPFPLDKALRILPAFLSPYAQGKSSTYELRRAVRAEKDKLVDLLLDKAAETRSGTFMTQEMHEINRKIEKAERFLEATA